MMLYLSLALLSCLSYHSADAQPFVSFKHSSRHLSPQLSFKLFTFKWIRRSSVLIGLWQYCWSLRFVWIRHYSSKVCLVCLGSKLCARNCFASRQVLYHSVGVCFMINCWMYIILSLCLSGYLSVIHQFICLSVCVSVSLSVCNIIAILYT